MFLGPSLSLNDARGILSADYHPPVARGDVDALFDHPPDVIAIIDGVFHYKPAVSTEKYFEPKIRDYGYGRIQHGCAKSY